jgi:competence protein ComEC
MACREPLGRFSPPLAAKHYRLAVGLGEVSVPRWKRQLFVFLGAVESMRLLVLALASLLLAGCAGPPATSAPNPSGSTATTPTSTATSTTASALAGGQLRVDVVDVGQGDGTIWTLPDGSIIVYDCGPDDGGPAMTAQLANLGKAKGSHVLALIVSHGHLDHIGGCADVLANYVVENVYDQWYKGSDQPGSYGTFRQGVQDEGAALHDVEDDPGLADDVHIGATIPTPAPGIQVDVLWPSGPASTWDQIAEHSLVVRLSYGAVRFCFQGDIEAGQESAITAQRSDLGCTVYLMGHHGSKYASSAAWLSAIHPAYAPVSFGQNSYGHPTPEALCRVQQAGAQVYATQRLGTITFTTNGTGLTVAPDHPETKDYCATGADYWSQSTSATATPEPSTTPPPTVEPSGLGVAASVSNSAPCQNQHVTVHARVTDDAGTGIGGALVSTTWHYKTTTPTQSAYTDTGGDAYVDRGISRATIGYTVYVDVTATYQSLSAHTSTSFTPSC